MNKFNKKYQLWWNNSDGGYSFREFDDLDELPSLIPDTYTHDFYITQKVNIAITEHN